MGWSVILGREVACKSPVEKVPMDSILELEVDLNKWAAACAVGLGAGLSLRSSGPCLYLQESPYLHVPESCQCRQGCQIQGFSTEIICGCSYASLGEEESDMRWLRVGEVTMGERTEGESTVGEVARSES